MSLATMVTQLDHAAKENKQVPKRSYNLWRSGYMFDAIKGLRYGQSFCNYFDITDYILYYDTESENSHRYICKNYIQ
jgi:hypothetical protein